MDDVYNIFQGFVKGAIFGDVLDSDKAEILQEWLDGGSRFHLFDRLWTTDGGADMVAGVEGIAQCCEADMAGSACELYVCQRAEY